MSQIKSKALHLVGDRLFKYIYKNPKKNMLTKALGCTPYVEPDIRARNIEKNDILIMCSDGLTNMVKEEQIYETIKDNPSTAAEELIKQANDAGGYDNITVVIIS